MSDSVKGILMNRTDLHLRETRCGGFVWARVYDNVTTPVSDRVEQLVWGQVLDAVERKMSGSIEDV